MGGKCCIRDGKPIVINSSNLNNQNTSISNPKYLDQNLRNNLKKVTRTQQSMITIDNDQINKDLQLLNLNKPLSNNDILKKIERKDIKNSKEASEGYVIKTNNNIFEDYDFIKKIIELNFLIRKVDNDAKEVIIKAMSLISFEKNQIIFSEKNIAENYYILKEGKVKIFKHKNCIANYKTGDSFGEKALMYAHPRNEVAIADSDCKMWIINRKKYREVLDLNSHIKFEENKNFIESIKILNILDEDQKIMLCTNLEKIKYNRGDYIVREGEVGESLFIVKSGKVNCSLNGNIIRVLEKGSCFGEVSILLKNRRSLDVTAKSICECYKISTEMFEQMMGEDYINSLYLSFIKSAFSNSKYLKKVSSNVIETIYDLFEIVFFKKEDIVFKEYEELNNNIVVIITGSIMTEKSKELIGDVGNVLFEKDIIEHKSVIYEENIISSPYACLLLKAKVEKIEERMKGNMKKIVELSSIVNCLIKVSLFKNLTYNKIKKLAEKTTLLKFNKGSTVFKDGDNADKFYFIKKGKVNVILKGNYLRTLNKNEHFGERALFFNETRSASIYAEEDSEIYYISSESFKKNIDEEFKQYLMRSLALQDNSIQLNELSYIRDLGQGGFGKVILVRCSKNNALYALKLISKQSIFERKLNKLVEMENKILLRLDNPFIVKLVKTLKDDEFVYLLQEYVDGTDLLKVSNELGFMNNKQAQFYIASIIYTCNYLHNQKIINRDIKPENILIHMNGFIKLVDFGLAKIIYNRTSTVCGTPMYMAPEIITGEGYSFNIDYWSIGICLYEFIFGKVPFGSKSTEPMGIYEEVIFK